MYLYVFVLFFLGKSQSKDIDRKLCSKWYSLCQKTVITDIPSQYLYIYRKRLYFVVCNTKKHDSYVALTGNTHIYYLRCYDA